MNSDAFKSRSHSEFVFYDPPDWVCLYIFRLCRLWRTTTRKCSLSTETTDLLAWLLRILSSPSATYLPTSPHTRSNWAGMGKTWPHTSTCCLRPPGSSGLRHSTCPASLLCLVRSSVMKHETCIPLFPWSLAHWTYSLYVGVAFLASRFVYRPCSLTQQTFESGYFLQEIIYCLMRTWLPSTGVYLDQNTH